MNIPIERLEIAAKSLEDMPFVKQNWDKLQEAISADEYYMNHFKDKDPSRFLGLVEDFIEIDRQPFLPYMKWVLILYVKRLVLYEDIVGTLSSIFEYDKLKRTGRLPDEYKNIYDIRTPQELHRIVEKIEKKKNLILNSEIYHWEEKGEIEIHDEFPKFKVVIPLTLKGAQAMSKGTNWCTTWDQGRFDSYVSKGTLYILIINHKAAYQFYSEGDVPYFTERTNHNNERLEIQSMLRLRNKYTMILRNAFPDKIEFGNLSSKEKFDALMNRSDLNYDYYLSYVSPDDFTVKEWIKILLEKLENYPGLIKQIMQKIIAKQNLSNISFKEKEILWDAVVEQGFPSYYVIPIRISEQIFSTKFLLYYIERVDADRDITYTLLFAKELGMLSLDVQKAVVDRFSINESRLAKIFRMGYLDYDYDLFEWIQENHPQIYEKIE